MGSRINRAPLVAEVVRISSVLSSFLPFFLSSFLPCFLASFLPCFLSSSPNLFGDVSRRSTEISFLSFLLGRHLWRVRAAILVFDWHRRDSAVLARC